MMLGVHVQTADKNAVDGLEFLQGWRPRASSNRPVLIRSEIIMGFEVAPVAPSARLRVTRSGSIESSHSLVPVAISDCSGVGIQISRSELFERRPTFILFKIRNLELE